MKIIMLQNMQGLESYEAGETYEFPNAEAIRLIEAEIAKPKVRKEFDEIILKVKEEEQIELEKQKQAAALLAKEELEAEREKLQIRVDEITNILGDAEVYYKSYQGLGK